MMHPAPLLLRAGLALALLVGTPALTGCWMMAKRSDSMIGRDRDALFTTWGPPQQSKPDGRGHEIWIYVEEDSSTSQGALKIPSLEAMNQVISEVAAGKPTYSNDRWQPTTVKVSVRTHLFWIDGRGKVVKAQTIEP